MDVSVCPFHGRLYRASSLASAEVTEDRWTPGMGARGAQAGVAQVRGWCDTQEPHGEEAPSRAGAGREVKSWALREESRSVPSGAARVLTGALALRRHRISVRELSRDEVARLREEAKRTLLVDVVPQVRIVRVWGWEMGGEPGIGSREPGAGSREPGIGSREPGAGSREPGIGSREPGIGSREPGAGSREQGAGTEEGTGAMLWVDTSHDPLDGPWLALLERRFGQVVPDPWIWDESEVAARWRALSYAALRTFVDVAEEPFGSDVDLVEMKLGHGTYRFRTTGRGKREARREALTGLFDMDRRPDAEQLVFEVGRRGNATLVTVDAAGLAGFDPPKSRGGMASEVLVRRFSDGLRAGLRVREALVKARTRILAPEVPATAPRAGVR